MMQSPQCRLLAATRPFAWGSELILCFSTFFALAATVSRVQAQESPYLVTYDHYLEEPGSLEVEYFSTYGTQRKGNDYHAFWSEFEYGATAW